MQNSEERPAAAPQASAPVVETVSLVTPSQALAAANGKSAVAVAASATAGGQPQAGNYDPTRGLLFKALHLIETEIFYSEPVYQPLEQYGRVQGALAYLERGPPPPQRSHVSECSS